MNYQFGNFPACHLFVKKKKKKKGKLIIESKFVKFKFKANILQNFGKT